MTVPTQLTPDELKALRDQAIIDLVAVAATTIEMVAAGHDPSPWIADQTAHWTGDHGRQAVLLLGMLASGAQLDPTDIATMGHALLGN